MNFKPIHDLYVCAALSVLFLGFSQILVAASGCDGAGNCYIYASATGTGTGASWTNAYTGFGTGTGKVNPASMTRGVTYWIAAGSYGGVAFSTAASGTSVITIEAATTSNHGPDSTWSNSYAGVATFGESSITTSYWTINGQAWPSGCSGLAACGVTGYNIYFDNPSDGSGAAITVSSSGNVTNITFEYVEFQGTGRPSNWATQNGNSDDGIQTPVSGSGTVNNFYVGYSYIHDVGADLIGSNGQSTSTLNNGSGHTYEHDWFARNWHGNTGSSATHTQAMSECVSNFIVRYNVFFDTVEDGVIDVNVSNQCTMSNWYVYGNTVEWDGSVPSIRQALVDGFLGFFGETVSGVIEVYNNTFANITGSSANVNVNVMFICGTSCGSSGTAAITIYNNLFWESGSSAGQGPAGDWVCDSTCTSETPTADYNQGYCPSTGCPNGGGYTPSGSHDVESNTGNPFVNFDGVSNFNVSLVADTSAGLAVSGWSTTPSGCTSGTNCENIDPLDITRGANGTIDRGAFQIASAAPNPPTNLVATPH